MTGVSNLSFRPAEMTRIFLLSGILGHDIYVDENGQVELNYTVLDKRGDRKCSINFTENRNLYNCYLVILFLCT